jgi:lipopolysaccharide transport system ATP-binding protein
MPDQMIQVEGLGKKYIISHESREQYTTLRDEISRGTKKLFAEKSTKSREDFWALKDVSFSIKKGEAVGIIGRNGAGKSTLLKILSRITEPTKGRVTIQGRVASLLEVGTGFHQELTGKENIFLNGAILGMSKDEVKKKFDAIVDFSGVEKFIDTPVKRYSSGMYMRLAFAVAAHLEPEILLVDEVLAVGDIEFQKKCLGQIDKVNKVEGRTVLFVSHQMGMIAQLCSQSILLQSGKIVMMGDTREVIDRYLQGNDRGSEYRADPKKMQHKSAYIGEQRICNVSGKSIEQMASADPIIIEVQIIIREWDPGLELSVSLQSKMKGRIFTINKLLMEFMNPGEKQKKIRITIPAGTITPGHYSWLNSLHIPGSRLVDVLWDECDFRIVDAGTAFARYDGTDYGVIILKDYRLETINQG